jgi:hypothetical protein
VNRIRCHAVIRARPIGSTDPVNAAPDMASLYGVEPSRPLFIM